MKILSNKRYKKLLDYESKYRLLTGQTVTFCTGERSRYKALLSMEKEEIEELKDFTIDLTDIDELALGLEVCSKKSNMVIQEFANLIIELEQQNKKYKEVIDKAIEYIKNASYFDGSGMCANDLLAILEGK